MPNQGCVGYADHSAQVRTPGYERALMRLTLAFAGLELDVTLGLATADEDPPDQGAAVERGTAASTPISFVGSWPTPAEWQPPERTLPWEVEEP